MAKPRDRELLALAREYDLTIERGGKHWKIRAADGTLVGVWPLSGNRERHGARGNANLVAQIRRHARGPEDGAQGRPGA